MRDIVFVVGASATDLCSGKSSERERPSQAFEQRFVSLYSPFVTIGYPSTKPGPT
jgi:hypothetical protein